MLKLLDGYRGIVQCDGFRLWLGSSTASFFDIAEGGHAPIASEAVARIGPLPIRGPTRRFRARTLSEGAAAV
jgi:hypothetical protein